MSPSSPRAAGGSAELDPRRKRALFRAWHRGTREMDLIMGRFAERELAGMSEVELVLFEELLEHNEADVYAWVTGRDAVPDGVDAGFITRLGLYRGTHV